MATSAQTDELERNLSDNDLAALMSEICDIGYSHVLAFGVQLQISGNKIEELRIRLHTHNDKNDILLQILQEALKRELPLTRKEIITALQNPSVEENRLASQIRSRYRPLSQGDLQAPQSALFQQMPLYQPPHLTPLHPTSGNISQTLSNIQPPPLPNTSHSFASQQLTTELPRANQPQPHMHQVGQSHQLPANLSMLPPPAPQTSQSVSLQPQPGPSLSSLQWTPELQHLLQLPPTYQPPPSAPPYLTPGNIPQTSNKFQPPPSPNTSHLFDSQPLSTELPRADQPQPNLHQVGQSHYQSASLEPQPTPQTSQTLLLQPQPGPSLTSLQRTPQMPTIHQLTPFAPPQTNILPSLTQPSPWGGNSQLAASQQVTTELLRPDQAQPNVGGQSHQLQTGSLHPQAGSSFTLSQRVPQLQGRPLLFPPNHSSYPLPPVANHPIHRPPESQSFSTHDQQSSHSHYSSFQPCHDQHSSITQPQHDQYCSFTQPSNNQYTFSRPSHNLSYFQPSRHTPYQQDQGRQSQQYQRQSPSQPPRQYYQSPVAPVHYQWHYTSDTNLPQAQGSQPLPAPTFAAISESTPFLLPSPSPRQQPSPLPRQQPSPSPRQQPYPSPRQQPIPVSSAGSSVPPPAKRLRKQSPSPPCHSSPASEATASTAAYPPLVDDFISFVKTTYSAQKVLRDEKWSLSPTVKFINLACIDRKRVKSREYNDVTKAMVMDGNVDVIEETKGPIKFSEIAKDISLPSSGSEQENDRRLILVEGAPGVGKSTFAWEFCRKWMNSEIVQQYHLVLLLRLRDKRIREAKNLKDLFFNPSRSEESLAVYKELKNSQKFHALIILEGYDELPDSCRNDPLSVFNELISGKLLPLATVLVTSRPWATKDLHEHHSGHIFQHIEVLGFTKKQIKEYINKNVGEEQIRSGLDSYLEKHPQIRSGMYIPLNSAIVVAVYKDTIENDRQNLPNTITELYSCCIEILIRRHLKRYTGLQGGNKMNLPAINIRVPSDVHRNFVHMCHLAFSGIVEATEVKLIFSESELPEHFDNLGFMDSVTDLYVTGETVSSHNFLHLTFQEFFAAVHISIMSKEQQLQYFRDGKSDSGSKKGRLNVMLKFLAGLRKLDCFTKETASHIVSTLSSSSYLTPSDITVGMDVVNWLFEAQSETAMSLILGERKVEFNASKSHMSPMDYYSLGYCISHSQCQWVLSLTGTMEISKEKIKMLVDRARDATGEAKVVELGNDALSNLRGNKLDLLFTEWNNILHLQKLNIEDIPTVWPDLSQLEVLEVSFGDNATEQKFVTIANHLPFAPRLKKFTLKAKLDIGCITAALASGQLQQLERLDLEVHIMTDNSTEFLITFLRNSSSLQHLSIRLLSSSTQKILELVQTIDHHPTLQEKSVEELACRLSTDVDVNRLSQLYSKYYDSMRTDFIRSVGGLSDDGVVVLAEFLKHRYRPRELNLNYSGTSDDGTVSLAKALHHNSTIHILKLVGNKITHKGAVALADTLYHNSTLQSLYLSNNSICYEGAVALADALHHNSTLQELYLNNNSIGDEGAVALADALQHNSTLRSLHLSNNSIGDEGAVALAEALLKNQLLQALRVYDNDGIGDRATGKFVEALTQNSSINKVYLPARCREYATKCQNYNQVQTKLSFC